MWEKTMREEHLDWSESKVFLVDTILTAQKLIVKYTDAKHLCQISWNLDLYGTLQQA